MRSYPKYKSSGVDWLGEIPSNWECMKIKRLSVVKRGASPRPIDDPKYFDENGEFAWVRISDVTASERYLENTTQRLSKLGNSLSVKMYPNDFFLSIAGSVGKPIITKIKCCIHDGFVWFPYLKINHEFLYYLFSTGLPYQGLGKFGTQLNLNTDTVGDIFLPIPRTDEMNLIVIFLDYKMGQCDRFIANRQKQIELLNEQKAAIINKAVTKGINPNAKMKPSGIEWIGDIPEHWKVKRPASFGRFLKGSGISKSDLVENGVPVILYGDIYTKYNLIAEHIFNFISQELASNSKPIYKGDLLFTGSGETREDIGKCIVYNGETKAYAGGDLMIFRQKTNSSLFLAYSFSTNYAITKKAMNSRGDIIIHIYASALRDIYIPIPSLSEQQGIIDFIKKETSKIENLISKYQKQIELMQEYRTALISQAVTGKIDVRDWKPPTK